MTIEDLTRQHLVHQYGEWLRAHMSIRLIDDWIEVTTPFLDRHNDYVQIYVKHEHDRYLLTDDGFTMNDLEQCGCRGETIERQEVLQRLLNRFHVQQENQALVTYATVENFAGRAHGLIQAMLTLTSLGMNPR